MPMTSVMTSTANQEFPKKSFTTLVEDSSCLTRSYASYTGGSQGHANGSLGGKIIGAEIFSAISGPWRTLTMAKANSIAVPGPRDVISLLEKQTRDSLDIERIGET